MLIDPALFNHRRIDLVGQLRAAPTTALSTSLLMYYHQNWQNYEPHPMGGFAVETLAGIARHMAALEDALTEAFAPFGARAPFKIAQMLLLLIEAHPQERTPLVLLSSMYLSHGQLDDALDMARKALTIDSRCIHAQWVMSEVYKAKHALIAAGRIDPASIDAQEMTEMEAFDPDLSDRFCEVPFDRLITNPTGDVHTCCPLLVPVSIGNVYEQGWDEIWNSAPAIEVRRSILDGDFKYCSRLQCKHFRAHSLPKKSAVTDPGLRRIIDAHTPRIEVAPRMANLGHDATCNLSCPQCRTGLILAKGELIDKLEWAKENFVLPMLKGVPHVAVTNSGDPFASKHYRRFMSEINPVDHPGLTTITLLTNGILFTPKEWEKFSNLHYLRIYTIISIDAARAETYHSIRRRGDFERLGENLRFISQLRRDNKILHFQLAFAVQTENFLEMAEFVRWAQQLSVDAVTFAKLANCGTYDAKDFAARSVVEQMHPRHSELLALLRDPIFEWDRIDFSNMIDCYVEAIGRPRPAAHGLHALEL